MARSLSKAFLKSFSSSLTLSRPLNSSYFKCMKLSSRYGLLSNLKNIKNSRSISLSSPLKSEKISLTIVNTDGKEMKREGNTDQQLYEFILETCDLDDYAVCGGTMSCSTCHIKFTPEDYKKLPVALEEELDILSYAPDSSDESRLACQIKVEKYMDGMKITIPAFRLDKR